MYLEYYNLNENPFNVTSDPAFLYFSRAHKEALSHLIFGIHERKGFIELTGEVGAGKTTLCRALLNELGNEVKSAFILNSNLSESQLLESIIDDFGIHPARRNKFSMIKALNAFLIDELRVGSNAILILDEAQNLKNSALEGVRLLSNLETEKKKLFQIILVGQPELRKKLASDSLLQLRQRIGVRFHISPLAHDEVSSYIYHRLKVAGSEGYVQFTDEALEKIYRYSFGIPRLINLVCDKSLLSGFVSETKLIDGGIVEKSISEIEGKPVTVTT